MKWAALKTGIIRVVVPDQEWILRLIRYMQCLLHIHFVEESSPVKTLLLQEHDSHGQCRDHINSQPVIILQTVPPRVRFSLNSVHRYIN